MSSSSEVEKALSEVKDSSAEFDQAMDEIKSVIESGSHQLSEYKAKGIELVDAVKNSKKSFEAYVLDRRKGIENYVLEKRNSMENFSQRFLRDFRRSASSGLDFFEQKPSAGWFVVFLSGFFLGSLLSKRMKKSEMGLSSTPLEVSGPDEKKLAG